MPSMRKIPQGTRPSSCGASSRAGAIRCTRLQGGPTPAEHLSLFLDMRLGIPLSFTGEFEVVIMIEVVTEEMHGSDWVLDLKGLCASLGWYGNASTRAKWRALRSARVSTPTKCLTQSTLSETPVGVEKLFFRLKQPKLGG